MRGIPPYVCMAVQKCWNFTKLPFAFLDLLCFSKVRHFAIGPHIRRIPMEELYSRPSFGIMSLYL